MSLIIISQGPNGTLFVFRKSFFDLVVDSEKWKAQNSQTKYDQNPSLKRFNKYSWYYLELKIAVLPSYSEFGLL